MKPFYYTLIALFLPFFLSAQSNYKPGYTITLKGDTLRGYIDYREWETNPTYLNFKTTLKDKANRLDVNSSSGFGLDSLDNYKRFKVAISQDENETSKLSNGIDTSFKISTVFLRVVATGKNATLYAYRDEIKNRFYIQKGDTDTPFELINRFYYNPEQPGQVINQEIYKPKLVALFYNMNTAQLNNKISSTGYSESSLSKIVYALNGTTPTKLKTRTGSKFFIGLGANIAHTSSDYTAYQHHNPISKTSVLPKIDLGIDFFRNINTQQFFIRAELSLTASKIVASTYTYSQDRTKLVYYGQNYNQYTGTLAPQAFYNFYNTNTVKIHAGIGLGINYSSYSASNTDEYDAIYVDKSKNFRKVWLSGIAKLGISINNKYEFFTGYVLPSQLLDHDYSSVKVSFIQAGIHYYMGK